MAHDEDMDRSRGEKEVLRDLERRGMEVTPENTAAFEAGGFGSALPAPEAVGQRASGPSTGIQLQEADAGGDLFAQIGAGLQDSGGSSADGVEGMLRVISGQMAEIMREISDLRGSA